MPSILSFDSGRALTDMTVVELAIMLALLRHGPAPAPIILPMLADWFGKPELGVSDLRPFIARLIRAGHVRDESGTLVPEMKARETVTGLYGTLFRILGSDIAHLFSLKEPSIFDLLKKGD